MTQVIQNQIDIDSSTMGVADITSTISNIAERTGLTYELITYHYAKRLLDLTLVCLSIPLLLPIMLMVAVFIKLDSKGAVFYRQERVGAKRVIRNGKIEWETATFKIWKFRSMFANTDDAIHQAHVQAWINGELENDDVEAKAKVKNDPRITRVGRFIRKTSLDELPQLFNVVTGQMSIVGPRPVPAYEVAQYEPEHYERLEALPGLTGLWQVLGRGIVSFDEMMTLDIQYVRTRTLVQDIMIIVKTVPAVLSGSGAE